MVERDKPPQLEQDEQIALSYQDQIARLCTQRKLSPDQIVAGELHEMYSYQPRSGPSSEHTKGLLEKYIGIPYDEDDRELDELRNELKIVTEGMFDMKAGQHTFGKFAPSYVPTLLEYAHKAKGEQHRALMVGALTPTTTREFVTTMQHVLGSSTESHVIDIEGERTASMDLPKYHFHKGDFFKNELPANRFHVIVTNFLMRFLLEPYPVEDYSKIRQQFAGEAYRLLAPGGRLVMVDVLGERTRKNPKYFLQIFENAGFDMRLEPALSFERRQDIDAYYQDLGEDFSGAKVIHEHPGATLFVAEKKKGKQWLRRLMRRT